MSFGVNESHFPRFVVREKGVENLGEWTDGAGTAFAVKSYEGYTSVYVGTAPLPVQILRLLAERAGVRMWSSMNDIVYATEDAVMIVATEKGARTLTLPKPMVSMDGGSPSAGAQSPDGYRRRRDFSERTGIVTAGISQPPPFRQHEVEFVAEPLRLSHQLHFSYRDDNDPLHALVPVRVLSLRFLLNTSPDRRRSSMLRRADQTGTPAPWRGRFRQSCVPAMQCVPCVPAPVNCRTR